MKRVLKIVIPLGVLLGLCLYYRAQYKQVENDWKIAVNNEKAYKTRLDESNVMFQITTDELYNTNDSIFDELAKTKKELKIKDKNIKQLQYISSTFNKIDTLLTTDTIFIEDLCIDTTMGDHWFQTHIHLHYPNSIVTDVKVSSEKNVAISSKRETVQPPKKFFLLRWFQKKHEIIKVDVVEKNPHIISNENTFIKIID